MRTVAVLGAGIQGACVALELAGRGVAVDLFDRHALAVSQASAANEGRIHLGYVYSRDPSLDTARLMARGALCFAPLLRRWIGAGLDRVPVSAPYYYAVHQRSLVPVERVASHLAACAEILGGEAKSGAVDYFGHDCLAAPRRIEAYDDLFDPRRIDAVFLTPEIALDPQSLAVEVRAALADEPKIRTVFGATVTDVAIDGERPEVEAEIEGVRDRRPYDAVVNTSWEGRLTLDARLEVKPPRPWLYRMKYFVRCTPRAAAAIPSSTIVLGPFGAAVRYGDGEVYLSWYPAGMRHTSAATRPPEWPRRLEGATAEELTRATLAGLGELVPAIAPLTCDSLASSRVEGGVIFALGESDIDDPASGLHHRSGIGVRSLGRRYHSIDTGKLSMAPLFATQVAELIAP